METRERTQAENGGCNGDSNENAKGKERELWCPPHDKISRLEQTIRYCHSARGIISIDGKWRLQIASSFWREPRRLLDNLVPREEQGTKDGRMTRAGMGAGTGAGKGTRIERRLDGRESLGTYQVVIEVNLGRRTRERGRRQVLTSSHSRKTRAQGLEGRGGEGDDREGRRKGELAQETPEKV